ncbi:MAG: hypothetical protein IJX99_02095 [Clostridia bacterium]|nr:hypothetical protein [Clostridia bacterium]
MTNRQWLMEQMQNMSDEELAKKIPIDFKDLGCWTLKCEHINCLNCRVNWLKSEHKEPIKLSDAERVILENVDKDYEWICRDKNGYLNVYIGKPTKNEKAQIWAWHTDYRGIAAFPNLFQFIKWEDPEPYNIEELLKGK